MQIPSPTLGVLGNGWHRLERVRAARVAYALSVTPDFAPAPLQGVLAQIVARGAQTAQTYSSTIRQNANQQQKHQVQQENLPHGD